MTIWAGYGLATMGVFHGVMTFVLFGAALTEIGRASRGAGSSCTMEMLVALPPSDIH